MRILLADDHPMIRAAIEVLLRDTGYEVVGMAGTGEAALDRDPDGFGPTSCCWIFKCPAEAGWKSCGNCARKNPRSASSC